MGRWVRFIIAIAVGIVIGLFYAWVLNPVELVETTPDTLHIDYKTDYVLMVAEVYEQDGDLSRAARNLALLGDEPPLVYLQQAITRGTEIGYDPSDLMRLEALRSGLQTWNPGPGEVLTP